MRSRAISTRLFLPGEDLTAFIISYLPEVPPGSVIAVASKILSLSQKRLIPYGGTPAERMMAIRQESDWHDPCDERPWQFTLRDKSLMLGSGVDESNCPPGYLLLPPSDPMAAMATCWTQLSAHYQHTHFGLLTTDSFILPIKQGVIGIALGWAGFEAIHDDRGRQDLYGQRIQMTTLNVPDVLATTAILEMGECDECQPLALIEAINQKVHFTHTATVSLTERTVSPIQHDVYALWFPDTLNQSLLDLTLPSDETQ